MPKKYTREGVDASARLACLDDDVETWKRVQGQYRQMIVEKGGQGLVELDDFCDSLSGRLRSMKNPLISKEDLMQVVKWKFAKGKPRFALMNYLKANSVPQVKQQSRESFSKADQNNVRGAVEALSQLKGVGPATASAILSLYRPDLFAFMDDEVIECLYDGKRGYTISIYLQMNLKCTELATKLGEDWTPRRVGRALWTAARIPVTGGDDLTIATNTGTTKAKPAATETKRKAPPRSSSSKRRRK